MIHQALAEFQPFGPDWVKAVRRLSYSFLEEKFGLPKGDCKNKAEYVDQLRSVLIVKAFNRDHPVGSKLMWRPMRGRIAISVTVKHEAYLHYGRPVAFFEEVSGFCCVEPEFIA